MSSASDHVARFCSSGEDTDQVVKLPHLQQPLPTSPTQNQAPGHDEFFDCSFDDFIGQERKEMSENCFLDSAVESLSNVSASINVPTPVPDAATVPGSAPLQLSLLKFLGKRPDTTYLKEKALKSMPYRIENAKARITEIDPGTKSTNAAPMSATSELVDPDTELMMKDWLVSHSGTYEAFKKDTKNIAIDFLCHFAYALPCLKCDCQHGFKFNGVSSMQFKGSKASGKSCSMSVLNILHALPHNVIELLVHAVAIKSFPYHTKNFVLWACSGRKLCAPVEVFYNAAYLKVPIAELQKKHSPIRKLLVRGSQGSLFDVTPSKKAMSMDYEIRDSIPLSFPDCPDCPDLSDLPLSPVKASVDHNSLAAIADEMFAMRMEMKQLCSHFQETTAQISVLMEENKLLKNKLESQVPGIISPLKPSFVQVVKEAASVVPGHTSPQSKKAKTASSPGPIDLRNNPVNNKVMAEKYKDLVIDDDDFFNSTPIRSNTGNLKFLYFRGFQRILD